jgi:hypothetical protein
MLKWSLEIGREGTDFIYLARDKFHWQAVTSFAEFFGHLGQLSDCYIFKHDSA